MSSKRHLLVRSLPSIDTLSSTLTELYQFAVWPSEDLSVLYLTTTMRKQGAAQEINYRHLVQVF